MLHTKYQGYKPCGFRKEDFFIFSLKQLTPGGGGGCFWLKGHNLNKLSEGPLGDATYIISTLGLADSDGEIFFMFSLYKPM